MVRRKGEPFDQNPAIYGVFLASFMYIFFKTTLTCRMDFSGNRIILGIVFIVFEKDRYPVFDIRLIANIFTFSGLLPDTLFSHFRHGFLHKSLSPVY